MEKIIYKVERIDGDYAHLRQIEKPEEDCKLVARALLPWEIKEGTVLEYEWLEYHIMDTE